MLIDSPYDESCSDNPNYPRVLLGRIGCSQVCLSSQADYTYWTFFITSYQYEDALFPPGLRPYPTSSPAGILSPCCHTAAAEATTLFHVVRYPQSIGPQCQGTDCLTPTDAGHVPNPPLSYGI